MPGTWDGFANPPNVAAIGGVQVTGGTLLPNSNLGTSINSTEIEVAASGGDLVGGTYTFLFTSGPSANPFNTKWGDVTVTIDQVQTYNTGGADNSITITNGKWYTMNWRNQGYINTSAIFMETSAQPVTINSVTDLSASVIAPGQAPSLTVALSANPSSEEKIFVVYTTDGFSTRTALEVTGFTSGSASVNLPAQVAATTIQYYVCSSIIDLTGVTPANAENFDMRTIKVLSGSSYTVANSWATSGSSSLWSDANAWAANEVPTDGFAVSIDNNLTLDQNATISSLTIASGITFTASDASARVLTLSRDDAGSATTITNSGGTWNNGTGGSTVVFAGTPNSGDAIHQTTGVLAFENVTVAKTGGANNIGVDFQTNSSVSGTLEIGAGGYVSTAPPASFYGGSAILEFNQGVGANYDVNTGDFSWSTTEIPQNITITSGTATLNSDRTTTGALIVGSGASLVVAAASDLSIGGSFTLDGTIDLRATSSGYAQLKVSGTLTDNGTINHEQYFTGGWQMVAASMNAATANYFGSVGTDGGTVNTQNLFSWDGTQYVNLTNNTSTITPGQGYFGYVGTNGFRTAANASYSFTGTPNTSVTPSLNNLTSIATMSAGSNDGWNLIANPFTCALDFTTLTKTNVNDAFYIYDPATSGYQSYSTGGITVGVVAPMQSFWVQANAGSPSLGTFTMSANGTVASAPQLYKNSINFDRLVLRTEALNDSAAVDYTVISFIENNSNHAFDGNWDARKLYNAGALPNIYTTYQGEEMAVNALNFGPSSSTTGSVDISYRAPNVGDRYSISFDKDYMLYRYMVILEDKKEGSFTDLGQAAYEFNYDDNYIDRFILHFSAQSISIEDFIQNLGSPQLELWAHEGAVHFQANYGGAADLSLIDLSGQTVWTQAIEFNQGERSAITLGSIKAGVYLLKSVDGEGRSKTSKVYLK